jgi:uncharacterized membrane protein YidH (DUF202 family)
MAPGEPTFTGQKVGSQEASEHRANQRTFLAWIAAGVSIMTFDFVSALFEGLLHELGRKADHPPPVSSVTLLSAALSILGLIVMGEAFFRVFRVSRSLAGGRFRPRVWHPVVVMCIACLLGTCVALALLLIG